MVAHHEVRLRLARAAVRTAERPTLRRLARLMTAEHEAELERMRHWWRSWIGGEVPAIDELERTEMPGMPPVELVERVVSNRPESFSRPFLEVMIRHHEGAIAMCRRDRRGYAEV